VWAILRARASYAVNGAANHGSSLRPVSRFHYFYTTFSVALLTNRSFAWEQCLQNHPFCVQWDVNHFWWIKLCVLNHFRRGEQFSVCDVSKEKSGQGREVWCYVDILMAQSINRSIVLLLHDELWRQQQLLGVYMVHLHWRCGYIIRAVRTRLTLYPIQLGYTRDSGPPVTSTSTKTAILCTAARIGRNFTASVIM